MEGKIGKIDNKFKRKETIIKVWDEETKIKANVMLQMKLADKRAMEFEGHGIW